LKELAKLTEENEPGCLSYGLFKNKESGKLFVVERYVLNSVTACHVPVLTMCSYFRYKDLEAVKAHGQSEYLKEAHVKGAADLENKPEVTVLSAYGGFQRS
jgi:quinol monooxygenase YgiN